MEIKRLSYRNKNNKFLYYLISHLRILIPSNYYQQKLRKKIDQLNSLEAEEYKKIIIRVNYYNQLEKVQKLSQNSEFLKNLKPKKGIKTYFFDLYEYSRYFNQNLKGQFLFGDVTAIPKEPGLVKSRPIGKNNINSVILKWNKIRHFVFIKKDPYFFKKTKNQLVFRAKVHESQPHRIQFLEKYFSSTICNIGKVNKNNLNPKWTKNRMTINEQLQYKFILCLEGNDVASNLKWVMSSNSIAVMPKPKYETWFMEGTLIPDYHYIFIKDDYSNLEEKITFYTNNEDECEKIIKNAQEFVSQFKDKKKEDLISLLVLEKYFKKTHQNCL